MIVTHNLQQAQRIADHVAFMYLGELVEYAPDAGDLRQPEGSAHAGVRQWRVRLGRGPGGVGRRTRAGGVHDDATRGSARAAGFGASACGARVDACHRREHGRDPTSIGRGEGGRQDRVHRDHRQSRAQGSDRSARSPSAIRRAAGATVFLNSAANLNYFQAHLPAIRSGRSLTWVYTTDRTVPAEVTAVCQGRAEALGAGAAHRDVRQHRSELPLPAKP